ncbi:hypothetical protein IQ268_19840 [Oculatella sp. LEGE 06141]|uniref:hypothetical protein n=1 Tax=Oculatella sp. LEGE 06141 TaxID=1828648 RepID=UPI001880511A|nr:hypothetical protein [Oculatella sp. LEGE 06141]MBE9180816.1 hypothetical protein [Oculatella sp. LEGE 06141]
MTKKTVKGFRATLWDALILDGKIYGDALDIPKHRHVALAIVALAGWSHAMGGAVILIVNRASLLLLLMALVVNTLSVIAGYYFWTFTILKIGQWLKPIDPTYGDLLSPIGFAYAPQVLNFLTLIPLLGQPIALMLAVWSLLAVTVAVREGLSISTRRAALICLVGWPLVQVAIGFIQVVQQSLV